MGCLGDTVIRPESVWEVAWALCLNVHLQWNDQRREPQEDEDTGETGACLPSTPAQSLHCWTAGLTHLPLLSSVSITAWMSNSVKGTSA